MGLTVTVKAEGNHRSATTSRNWQLFMQRMASDMLCICCCFLSVRGYQVAVRPYSSDGQTRTCCDNHYIQHSSGVVVAENDGVYDQVVSSLDFRRCHLSRFSMSSITSFRMTRNEELRKLWICGQVWSHEYADSHKMCALWTCRLVQKWPFGGPGAVVECDEGKFNHKTKVNAIPYICTITLNLAWVVRKVDNAIHRINQYLVDEVVCFADT